MKNEGGQHGENVQSVKHFVQKKGGGQKPRDSKRERPRLVRTIGGHKQTKIESNKINRKI